MSYIRFYIALIPLLLVSCQKDNIDKSKDYSGTYSCEVYETNNFTSEGPGFEDYFTDTTYIKTVVVEYTPDTITIDGNVVLWSSRQNDSTYSLNDNWDNSSKLEFRNDSIRMDKQNKTGTVGIGTLTKWKYYRGVKL